MILEKKYTIGIKDIGASNSITNKGFLNMLEDIACLHSNIAGYGLNQIPDTHISWILLNWKVSIYDRPKYNSILTIKTWSRKGNKFFTFRDFEIYDENNTLIGIASSKWTIVNVTTNTLTSITDDMIACYKPEEKSVFNETDIEKIKEPISLSENPNYNFQVQRRDIDINQHMHNLYYLDYAYEALPQKIYDNIEFNNFEIMYKLGAKLGNIINCYYSQENNGNYIVMKNNDSNKLNAIIKLY